MHSIAVEEKKQEPRFGFGGCSAAVEEIKSVKSDGLGFRDHGGEDVDGDEGHGDVVMVMTLTRI